MKTIRWWPVGWIAGLTALVLVLIQLRMPESAQRRVLASIATAAISGLLLLLWLLLFSRAPWKVRLGGLAAVLVGAIAFTQIFEYGGVTGDLMPVFRARWSKARTVPAGAKTGDELAAASYSQFLGSDRNGVVSGVELARNWEASPPKLLWRQPIGEGWSGFAVKGGLAVTLEQQGPEEWVSAYELSTGKKAWSHAHVSRHETPIGGIGPRSVPTLDGGRAYAMGATGHLSALDLATGRLLWEHDVVEEHHGKVPEWGKSCSPLVVDGKVIVSAGGANGHSLVAYDAATGALAWHAGDDRSGFSSPLLAELAGTRQIVIFNGSSVVAHHPEDGRVLWQFPWSPGQPNVSQPLPLPGDRLFVSSGYGIGGKMLKIVPAEDGKLDVQVLWESPRLKAKFSNTVPFGGELYGLDDGVLVCLDPETGERCWKAGRYGHGQLLLVGDLLLAQTEGGEVILIEPNPEELRELGRFTAVDGKAWNPPALAGNLLLVRNDREATAWELPTEAPANR